MNSRQRILAALSGYELDRLPITEIGIWPETIQRWKKEGLPEQLSPADYFGFDKIDFYSFDASLGMQERIISEGPKEKIFSDADGCTYRMFTDKPGSPLLLESSIKGPNDWDKLKDNLNPDIKRFLSFDKEIVFGEVLDKDQSSLYNKSKREDNFTVIVPVEPCWYYLRLLGEEEALATMAQDPDFAGKVIEEYTDFTVEMLKAILSEGYTFDALWVFSDLCYKNGMLFSPLFYMDKVFKHQRRIFDLGKENGMKIIYHCDGFLGEFLPLVLDTGIDCIQPLEVRAGNDVRDYYEKYPGSLSFMGNINMDLFTTSKEAVEAEINAKIRAMKNTNRYLFHSDHSVPDTVSFEMYSFAMDVAKKAAVY